MADENPYHRLLELIDARLAALKLSERKACLLSKLNVGAIQNIRKGRAPRVETLVALSKTLGIPLVELVGAATLPDRPVDIDHIFPTSIPGTETVDNLRVVPREENKPKPPHQFNSVSVPEVDIRAGMGGGGLALLDYAPDGNGGLMEIDAVSGRWGVPVDYLASELGVRPNSISIIPVQGDSMEPTLHSGDRVMVNLADRVPSPPGIFALWDGLGIVVKRIEYIPHSEPATVIISSDNQRHKSYERTADEVNIVGRVVWFARRL